jgi:glycosyltransferase involved in cell wall biosynthesis
MSEVESGGSGLELTILMPCLNEAETVATCVHKAMRFLQEQGVSGEVIVADNGSTDGSQQLASDAGARVVPVAARGYGAALQGGIKAARSKYVVMGDADDSYDFSALTDMLEKLRAGNDLVMGNRFVGGIEKGAMPFLHRWLGNPVLSFIGRLFYRNRIGDFHCGLRGFSLDAMRGLHLNSDGMEFASEMVVKSALYGLRISEVPVRLYPDGRSRPPHLRTWRDGWRHLRFLLLHSPRWLFLLPGLFLIVVGLGGMVVIHGGARVLGGYGLDIHTMAYLAAFSLLGLQMVIFSFFSKVSGILGGWLPPDPTFERRFSAVTLERCLILSAVLFGAALILTLVALAQWGSVGYGALDPTVTMRVVIPAITFLSFAGEIFVAGFFVEVIRLKARRDMVALGAPSSLGVA